MEGTDHRNLQIAEADHSSFKTVHDLLRKFIDRRLTVNEKFGKKAGYKNACLRMMGKLWMRYSQLQRQLEHAECLPNNWFMYGTIVADDSQLAILRSGSYLYQQCRFDGEKSCSRFCPDCHFTPQAGEWHGREYCGYIQLLCHEKKKVVIYINQTNHVFPKD